MTRRPLCLALLSLWPAAARAAEPNVLILLADDLGIGDLGAYNPSAKTRTPHLDRLARDGMRFTDAHAPAAVCTPTRYGLLTGRYSWRGRLKNGVLQGYSPALLEPGRPTLASVLKARGYATACIGKWHLGLGAAERTDYTKPLAPGPREAGFDHFYGIPASLDMEPYVYVEDDRVVEAPTARVPDSKSQREGGAGFWRGGAAAPSFRHDQVLPTLTRRAVAWLEARAKARPARPFFLYWPITGPHTPWLPLDRFQGASGAGPYGDFVNQVDAAVGEVLAALDRLGLAPNTLVIVTSDNGAHWLPGEVERYGHRANAHFRGMKADIHEAGHRVPLIVRWPGVVAPGGRSDHLVGLNDLFATVTAAAGAEVPRGAAEDSVSFLAALRAAGRKPPPRPPLVLQSGDGMLALRDGPWKLIDGLGSGGFTPPKREAPAPGGPAGALYDLASDPTETRNLFASKPAIVARLKARLEREKTGAGDPGLAGKGGGARP